MMQNQKRRVGKIEEQLGISGNDEVIEFPLGNGQFVRTTRWALDDFLDWLEGREDNGQEAIETD